MTRETLDLIGGKEDGRLIESDQPPHVLRVPRPSRPLVAVRMDTRIPPDLTFGYDEYEYRGRNDRGHLRMVRQGEWWNRDVLRELGIRRDR